MRGFWDTRMWKAFEREAEIRTVSFDQGAMGAPMRNRTTLGTNVNNLMGLDGLRVPEGEELPERGDQVGLVDASVVALGFWSGDPRCTPRMCAMTRQLEPPGVPSGLRNLCYGHWQTTPAGSPS